MSRHGFRRAWSLVVGGSLVLAALWAASEIADVALAGNPHKPPKDDGDAIHYRLARINIGEFSRIRWDGVAYCEDATHENDPSWDYWDQHDTALIPLDPDGNPIAPPEPMGIETSVSGGGRLFFFIVGRMDVEPKRWLVLDLTPTDADPMPYDPDGNGEFDSPDIDDIYDDPDLVNTDAYIDHVKCIVSLDRMFKKTATRQPLVVRVCRPADGGGWEPAGWSLHSVEDLYLLQDPDDKDVRTLSTSKSGEPNVDLFELWHNGEVVGVYCIPLSWKMRVVDAP